jgi:hypothetical protein
MEDREAVYDQLDDAMLAVMEKGRCHIRRDHDGSNGLLCSGTCRNQVRGLSQDRRGKCYESFPGHPNGCDEVCCGILR